MTLLWIILSIMLLAGLAFVVPVMLRKHQYAGIDEQTMKGDLSRQRMQELDNDVQSGLLDKRYYEQASKEIEADSNNTTVNADRLISSHASGKINTYAAAAIVILVPLVAGGLYLKLGAWQQLGAAHPPVEAPVETSAMNAPMPQSASPSMPAAAGQTETRSLPSVADMVSGLEQRLQQNPDNVQGWVLLGQSYKHLGQNDKALAAFRQALKHGGESPAIMALMQDLQAAPAEAAGTPAATGNVAIKGRVSVAASLQSSVAPGDTLYIFARAAGTRGMPLAVIRQPVGQWPVSFVLDDSKLLNPATSLASIRNIEVNVRISKSGNAIRQSGDLESSAVTVAPDAGTGLEFVIDKRVQ